MRGSDTSTLRGVKGERETSSGTISRVGTLTRSYMLRCRFLLTPPELVSVSSLASSLTGGRSRSSCRPIFRNTLVDMAAPVCVGRRWSGRGSKRTAKSLCARSGRYVMFGRRDVTRASGATNADVVGTYVFVCVGRDGYGLSRDTDGRATIVE